MDDIEIAKEDFVELIKIVKKLSKKIESVCRKADLDFERDISWRRYSPICMETCRDIQK